MMRKRQERGFGELDQPQLHIGHVIGVGRGTDPGVEQIIALFDCRKVGVVQGLATAEAGYVSTDN
jgi:hypothetical protein